MGIPTNSHVLVLSWFCYSIEICLLLFEQFFSFLSVKQSSAVTAITGLCVEAKGSGYLPADYRTTHEFIPTNLNIHLNKICFCLMLSIETNESLCSFSSIPKQICWCMVDKSLHIPMCKKRFGTKLFAFLLLICKWIYAIIKFVANVLLSYCFH